MRYIIEYFIKFKKFIGRKIYFLLFIMLAAGVVEGLGIALFLPILQDGFGDDNLSRGLRFLFESFNIPFEFSIMLIFLAIFFTFRAILLILYTRYSGMISANLVIKLRREILEKIFRADYLYLLKKEVGYINNAIVREVPGVVDALAKFASILSFMITGLVYVILAVAFNPIVAASTILVGFIFAVLMKGLNRMINDASIRYSLSHGNFHSILIQVLSKIKYLKSTFSYGKISNAVERENKHLGAIRFTLSFLQSLGKHSLELLTIYIVVGLLFYQVNILQRGVSEVIFLVLLFYQAARQFVNSQASYRKFLASRGCIEVFNTIEKELSENEEDFRQDCPAPDFNSDIQLKGVTLIFPNGKKALDNVSMKIGSKATVALVGHSGSGKSTIANMVTGMLKPTSGDILFGHGNYNNINLKALRENIGYVTQEDVIFNATIKDNISLWDENADDKKLEKVIEIAYLSRFIEGLGGEMDEPLGDNGLDISGGQRQRVTIARELYKETKLLILDEATSSLDSKSEKSIYENMRQFKGEKTMLVIAHRLSTIKNADYIYVFDEGKIIEEGTYDDLLKEKGEFKKMINDQSLVEDQEEPSMSLRGRKAPEAI